MTSETKITISGKEYGLIFGYTAYKRFIGAIATNRDLFYTAGDEFTDEAYIEIIFTAYENHCFDKRKKIELTRDNIGKWIDEQYESDEGKELLKSIYQLWNDSTEVKKLVEAAEKKKQRAISGESTGAEFDELDTILLGRLKYKPWELHRITFREVHLAIDGYFEENKFYHDLLQLSTRLICLSGFNAKAALKNFNKAWPVRKKEKNIEKAKETLRKLRELDEANKKKVNAGRTET